MYQRIKAALVNPRKIVDYVNDRLGITIIYLIIFSLLFALPYLLIIKDFGSYFKSAITKDVQKNEVIEYVICDGKLTSKNEEAKTHVLNFENTSMGYFNIVVGNDLEGISKDLLASTIIIQYAEDGIYFTQASLIQTKTKLLDYTNDFVDLSLMKSGDLNSINGFTKYIDIFLNQYKSVIYILAFPSILIYSIGEILLTTLMSAILLILFFGKYGIKFGKIYKITLYCALPTIIGVLLSILFSSWPIFGIFKHIGFFATTCFSIIAINELAKRNFIKNKEENNNESI
jgi:hypothetical protein